MVLQINKYRNCFSSPEIIVGDRMILLDIHKVMKNKSLNFNQTSFSKLIKNFYSEQVQLEKSKKDLFQKAIWSENRLILTGQYRSIEIDENEVIFSIDDKEWSVNELQQLIDIHPLVFRNKKISKKELRAN